MLYDINNFFQPIKYCIKGYFRPVWFSPFYTCNSPLTTRCENKTGGEFPLYTVAQRRITLYFISLIFFYQKCSNIINWFFFFTKNVPTFVTHLKLPILLCDTESAAITLAHIWNIHWLVILRSVYKDYKKGAQNKS